MRKAQTDADAEDRHGIIARDDFAKHLLEGGAVLPLRQCPLLHRHERRFDCTISPRAAEPHINLPVTPKCLLSPREPQSDRERLRRPWRPSLPPVSLPG